MRLGPLAPFFAFAALAGCGSPAPSSLTGTASSSVTAAASGPTLTFAADWTESSDRPLHAGDTVTVSYDPSRLPTCRGTLAGGAPGWSITAFYSVNGGPPGTLDVAGYQPTPQPQAPVFTLPAGGDLAVWFQITSAWGCSAYDSNFGSNYHFTVAAAASAPPAWMGGTSTLVDRATCGTPPGPCYADAHAAESGFDFDTWARQRAAITRVFFEVWQPGVTDFDNPDLWKQLDVELHARIGSTGAFTTSYVDFSDRDGHNARYAVDLRPLDPLPGSNGGALTDKSQCPTFPTTISAEGQYLQADFEYYFTVNGAELRPASGAVFQGTFQNYLGLYAVCGFTG